MIFWIPTHPKEGTFSVSVQVAPSATFNTANIPNLDAKWLILDQLVSLCPILSWSIVFSLPLEFWFRPFFLLLVDSSWSVVHEWEPKPGFLITQKGLIVEHFLLLLILYTKFFLFLLFHFVFLFRFPFLKNLIFYLYYFNKKQTLFRFHHALGWKSFLDIKFWNPFPMLPVLWNRWLNQY